MKKILFIFITIYTVLNANMPQLTVSILPQKYFVEKIVKDKFEVNVMVNPGSSPHTYEPKSSQMKALATSKAYFYTGVSFEQVWLDKFKQNSKNTLFIDMAKDIEKIEIAKHEHEDEHKNEKQEKHEDEKHDHSGLDPHVWLDPILVKVQAKNIYEAMLVIDSLNADFYKTNYEEFLKELDILDENIKTILKPYAQKAFMVFHPSWGYFAKRYALEEISIEVEGKEPKPNELIELINEAKKHDVKIVFISPQFSQKSAKTISKNIGANVISIDSLAENWNESLINTAKQIANSYK